jgi:lipoprotein-releasing system ATP-binding protein
MNEVLRAGKLCKDFIKGGRVLHVLRGIDFGLSRGEFAAVTGASGAGKSTLLHLLGALDAPTSGSISIDGKPIDFADDRMTSLVRNRMVGFVFQFHHLLPDFSALENTLLPALIAGTPRAKAEDRAREILTDLGLYDRLTHRPYELSGGEQQRVAIARGLVNEPELLLLDEPTGNLDRKTGEDLMSLLAEIRSRRKLSVVMVTHNESLAELAGKAYRLEDGILKESPGGAQGIVTVSSSLSNQA